MNKTNVKTLIDYLKAFKDTKPEVGFSMNFYTPHVTRDYSGHNCGTSCCLAGHADILGGSKICATSSFIAAKIWLDLNDSKARDLFIPVHNGALDITPEQAITTLEHLLKTGDVVWQ